METRGQVMSPTPFERRLREVAREAVATDDAETIRSLTRMIAFVQQRQYGGLRPLFDQLRPAYQQRVGIPPASREEDAARAPNPPGAS